jgi:antitoxin CptB
MRDEDRVRWHCRRGMLELDLVLSKFLDKHYGRLDLEQKAVFKELLDLPDNDLWDLLSGKASIQEPRIQNLIKLFD